MANVKEMSLQDRLRASVGKAGRGSLATQKYEKPAPPPDKKKEVADIRSFIPLKSDRDKVVVISGQLADLGKAESEIKKAKKPLVECLKKILGDYQVGEAMVGENKVLYYNVVRKTLSVELLLEAGVPLSTINSCYVEKDAYTLRVMAPGQKEEEE